MRRITALLATVGVFVATSFGMAALAPQSEAELNRAKVIVVGKINGTYKEIERDDEWENSHGVVEIEVEKVERGEKIKPGDVIFARFHNQCWIKKNEPPPLYGTGHYLYGNGTKVRAYLHQGNGAYVVMIPNGLVPFEKTAERTDRPKVKPVANH
jgi:hypothetical protein